MIACKIDVENEGCMHSYPVGCLWRTALTGVITEGRDWQACDRMPGFDWPMVVNTQFRPR